MKNRICRIPTDLWDGLERKKDDDKKKKKKKMKPTVIHLNVQQSDPHDDHGHHQHEYEHEHQQISVPEYYIAEPHGQKMKHRPGHGLKLKHKHGRSIGGGFWVV